MKKGLISTVSRLTFRQVLPRVVGASAKSWKALPTAAKTAAVTAAATAAGVAITGNLAQSDPDAAAGEVLNALAEKDISTNVDAVGAMLAALPTASREDLLKSVANSEESAAVAQAIAIAAARHSSTMASGDHVATPYAPASAYDEMVANINLVKRAMAALGVGDPAALRAVRDAMFMDEQAFSAAIERI